MLGFVCPLYFSLVYLCQLTDGACEFPSDLRGEWYTTSNGLVTFTNQSISNFKSLIHTSTHTFDCEYIDNGRYITRARIPVLSTSLYDVYFCMSFTKVTETKYLVNYNSDILDFVQERVVGKTVVASSSTLLPAAEACNLTSAIPIGTQEVYVKKGNETSDFITCPDSIASTLDMTLNSDCTGNIVYGMTNPTYLIHTYNSSCASTSLTFTTSGNVSCIYSVLSGFTTYLTVYNMDSSTDETNTYRFLCYVITSSGDQVYLTYHPKICQYNQTSTYVASPGVMAYLVDQYKEATLSDDEVPIALIVGTTVPILLLLGIILFIVYWKIKFRNKINHELEMNARRNWRKLAQHFNITTKHTLGSMEEYANHSKRHKKKKKKKRKTKENSEIVSISSQTDSRRRSVWWDDFSNTIEEHHEPQPWQNQWETFNDPLSKQMMNDDGRKSPSTARSDATVRKIWMNPENTEKVEVDSVWEKVASNFDQLRKAAKPSETLRPR
ncbi:uncharacterized protein LOC133173616 [Saccostrea echinata]|uniref:uncharacterized protein LOC133173616 n=1 Tax=Saccostrea echinata TaxID=191078 RepID=UPI002A82ECB2|nr:uncharacterized protein LOC133173616 [Saccostrea echinata]